MKSNPQIKKPVSKKLPKNSAIKTTWNLELLYKSPKDPQIEKDMQAMEKACADFAKKWKGKDFSKPKILLDSLHDYEKLEEVLSGAKPIMYFYFSREIDTGNQKLSGIIQKMEERLVKSINETLFFHLAIGKLSKKVAHTILTNTHFARYRYILERIFNNAKHQLSEAEEKIIQLKSSPAYQQWVTANEKGLGALSVKWKGKKLPITQASGMIQTLQKQSDRKRLHGLVIGQLKTLALIAESEINAVITNKKIDDDLRGFSQPYESTLIDYHNTEAEIMPMINAVRDSYQSVHRLFRLKKKLLKIDQLGVYDMSLELSAVKKTYSFDDAITIIQTSFEKVHPEYRKIFDQFLSRGQIDIYPRHGKKGGGYCAGDYGRPTYILLNWNNTFDSVRTLAHEMGHAIHAEYSNLYQGALYHDHPVSTAEVASTLFENFVRDELFETLSPREKIFARFNHLQETVTVIHRQVSHFEFEKELHNRIHIDGSISANDLTKLRSQYLQSYIGSAIKIDINDGWSWIPHSHLRFFFYTYSYAYGQLISTAMYAKYKQDNSFVEKINQFLSAGGSDTPENIFKSIGIDTTKPDFWKIGLDAIEQDIKDLEKECKKLKLI